VQLADAVDLVAAGQAEVRHADLVVGDNGHIVDLAPVVRVVAAELVDQAAVDLHADGVHARKLLAEQVDVPALERLAHDGVVRIGQGAAADVPRGVPREVMLVDQQTHQLRHAERRVGVVDMDGDLVGQIFIGAIFFIVALEDGLQRGRNQQILLLQAQTLALNVVVGRVEHLGDRLGHGVALERADIIAAGERGHIEALRQLGTPEDQAVGRLAVIAGDEHIVRHGNNGVIADLRDLEAPHLVDPLAHLAAELDLDGVVLARAQPDVAHVEPCVGEFHLPAVDDLLAENAELIADGIAGHGQRHAGRSVHIARGKTAEAAVSEAGVRLHFIKRVEIEADLVQRLAVLLLNAEIEQIVMQARADKEFHGHIIDFLALLGRVVTVEEAVLLGQLFAHERAQRAVDLLLRSDLQLAAEKTAHDIVQLALGLGGVQFGLLGCFHGAS